MICICEELDCSKYGLSGKVAILENKQSILTSFGLKNERWLQLLGIDPRLLTVFYHSLDSRYDWFIVVYDYSAFCKDQDIKEAILWHELGHIQYPVQAGMNDLDSEIKCDELAVKQGFQSGLEKVLDLTLEMARHLNHEILQQMTTARKLKITG